MIIKTLDELNKFKNTKFNELWIDSKDNYKIYEKLKRQFLKSTRVVFVDDLKKEIAKISKWCAKGKHTYISVYELEEVLK